ncbi:MAG: rod shape-determining protein RodA [Coriobacteriaceae bacterium]|jgi:rod shape determining protein RodA|nr:rod shape-determining protein RodA [Coriobacteriaceae bacterium]
MAGVPEINTVAAPDPSIASTKRAPLFRYVNLPFLAVITLVVGYGLLVVWSAVLTNEDYSFSRQAQGVAIGAVLMALLWRFDYRLLSDFATVLLAVNVALILSPHLPILGVEAKGATSWISIFGFQLQPGEFAKLTVILMAASVVSRYGGRLDDPREYCKALGILLVPFLCVMTQPDLGTGLVYLFIAAVALVMGGAKLKYLLITLGAALLALGLLLLADEMIKGSTGEYKLLKDYQRARLLVFIDQSYAQSDEGYNLNQAKIAIGSGGLMGKGLTNATQSTLGFLPEAPTDFIFCVLAEELGFFGVLLLLALYGALVLISFRIAVKAGNLFGTLIVFCVLGMWLFQILENIGMTCGLMPITGIPLPFMSYGSSFMLVNFMLLGLVGSVWARGSR